MERRQTDQGLKGPRYDVVVSSLGFLFASCIPDLELKKLATWKCKKNLQGYSLFKKELGKGQPSKTENFSKTTTLLQPKPKEKSCSPTFTHGEGPGEQLRLSPSPVS